MITEAAEHDGMQCDDGIVDADEASDDDDDDDDDDVDCLTTTVRARVREKCVNAKRMVFSNEDIGWLEK